MKQNIIHIGFDVGDKQYHGSALNYITGEFPDFKYCPNLEGLPGQLDKLHKYYPGSTFKLCYEASSKQYEYYSKKNFAMMGLFRPLIYRTNQSW